MPFPIINHMQLNATERELIPKESITSIVWNLCNFQCDKCNFRSSSFNILRAHLKKCKGNGKFHCKYVIDAIFHECKICGTISLCDKVALWKHVHNIHNLKMEAYEALSMLSNGLSEEGQTEKVKPSVSTEAKVRNR